MIDLSIKIRRGFVVVLIAGYVALGFALWQIPDGKFHIYFLNIGQGDSILVKTPENHQILIDGGPENLVIEELAKVMPFLDKSIDLVILSHPHADHMDGLLEVLHRYEVANILITGVNYESEIYDEFLGLIVESEAKVFVADGRTDFSFGETIFDVLNPTSQLIGENFDNINNSSVVAKILYKENKILLVGDMELEAEQELLASGIDLSADILKAGHHGSRTSSSLEFLRKVQPKVVVIQSGQGNSFGHPHEETLENLKMANVQKVYRNDLDGMVEFILD